MAALAGQPVESATKMIEDLFATGILGGVTEAVPQMAVKAVSAPAKAFQKSIHPRGREAMEVLSFENRPSLAQISRSRATDISENVAEASLFGGGKITRGKAGAEREALGKLEAEVGKLPAKGDPRLNRLSDVMDELGKGVVVDTTHTQRVAEKLLAKERPLGEFGADDKFVIMMKKVIGLGREEELIPGIPATKGPAGYTAQVGGRPAQPPVTAPRAVDFTTARGIRRQLVELARQPVGALASQSERGAIRHLASLFKKDMLDAAAEGGHQALVRTFQDFNKIGKQASTRGHFEDAITKATTVTPNGPLLDGNKMINNLYHAKKELRGSLDPEALSQVEKFSRVLQLAQSKSLEGTGRMMVQLTQAGAMGAVVTGKITPKASAFLVLPDIMARALTNPRLYRYLTEGFKNVGTPRGSAAINTLISEMQSEEATEQQEMKAPYKAPWE